MKVKICGLMNEYDVKLCESLGVDILGFVVEYPREVPWNLTRDRAKELLAATQCPTCIVTGGISERVIALARELKPDMVQLHYKETVMQTAEIAKELTKWNIQTVKAVDTDLYIEALCETDIAAILVDTRTAENAAQNIQMIDTDLFNRIKEKSNKPLIIAGGITPENVGDIVSRTGANWIDVLTGVECSPGNKDKEKIEALTLFVHSATHSRLSLRNRSDVDYRPPGAVR